MTRSATLDADVAPAGMERKAATPGTGIIDANEATGEVDAVVSVTGVVDEHGDIIMPGAYSKTLQKRNPKGIWSHQWDQWVARTEEITELLPGDPRLPAETRGGSPWPREAGALLVKARFNMRTQRGQEAFSDVVFFKGDTEYSIDYVVPRGGAKRPPAGGDPQVKRLIGEMDLFAWSPVLFGAAALTSTRGVKSLVGDGPAADPEQIEHGEATASLAALHEAAAGELDLDEIAAAAGEVPPELLEADPGGGEGAEESPWSFLDGSSAEDAPAADVEVKAGAPGVADTPGDRGNVRQLIRWYEHGEGAAQIRWGEPGDFMRCVRIAAKHMPEEQAKGFCNLRHRGAIGVAPGQEGAGKKLLIEAYDPRLEVGPDAGHAAPPSVERKSMPRLTGSYEQRRDALDRALNMLFLPPEDMPEDAERPAPARGWVTTPATFDDRVIATVEMYGPDGRTDSYEVPYTFDADAGEVTLGEPQPVKVTLSVEPGPDGADAEEAAPGDALPLPEMIDDVTMAAKLLPLGRESKSGRVLSGANTARIRAAVKELIAVLTRAGVPFDMDVDGKPDTASVEVGRPVIQSDSTAPSANPSTEVKATVHVGPDLVARALRLRAGL